MSPADHLRVIAGTSPVVLVAPHGGRRDAAQRRWGEGPLKVNDLHTAALTAELAAASGASALINESLDRNEVDLNRISQACARAPEFLARLGELLDATLARHGRATLLTVHGWNVIQPALDVGLGCSPAADPFAAGPGAAVSPAFATSGVRALIDACRVAGIAATVGARYPARARENLLQLFTPRYRDDERPLVRALAGLSERVEALQIELGIPLRWPGGWRRRFGEAYAAALPRLSEPPPPPVVHRSRALGSPTDHVPRRHWLQFISPAACGLVAVDGGRGGRVLLFPPEGGLYLFTGERTGGEPPGTVAGLTTKAASDGTLDVRFTGPLLCFSDTTPFVDLEHGLAGARLVEAELGLRFSPAHAGATGAEFGAVAGEALVDGTRLVVDGHGFVEDTPPIAPWPRVRAALRLDRGAALVVTVGLDDAVAAGFLCRDGVHLPVARARAVLEPSRAAPDRVVLEVELEGGEALRVAATVRHRLPVVRGHGPQVVRILFATCCVQGTSEPAGWCEVGGL